MDWGKSYSATWRVYKVNRKTWADGELLGRVDEVTVTRTADGNLLESGSMQVTGDTFEPDYYRIVMIAEQGGEIIRSDIATMLFDVSGGQLNYQTTNSTPDGYSVLYPASTTSIIIGQYAPAGVDGAKYAQQLLQSAINAPVEVEGSFILNDHIIHEFDSSVLSAVWSVLNAGNFIMRIDGRGVVHIEPKPTEPEFILDNISKNVVINGINHSFDISHIPNRYVIVNGVNVITAKNDDPESVVSTTNRGYIVDLVDKSPTLINGETYGEYALRKLKESSIINEDYNYTREYVPNLHLYSVIKSSINEMQGNLRIISQGVTCNNGITVNEKVTKEIQLW